MAPAVTALTERQRATRRLILQKARHQAFPAAAGHSPLTVCRRTVSGSISLPSPGCFSPFPHGTCALSVAREYLALGGGPPCFPQDFPCPVVLRITGGSPLCFRLQGYHLLRLLFPEDSANRRICNSPGGALSPQPGPATPMPHRPARHSVTSVWAVPLSLATTQGILSFPAGTKMFQFPAFPSPAYGFSGRCLGFTQAGFPIRASPDITPAHGSPRLIAVCHALHRLLAPRHPPYALSSLP